MDKIGAIHVDDLMPTPQNQRWRWSTGCHLFHAQHDLAQLDAFARHIGMRTAWRHDAPGFPHYDLHPRYRAIAILHGAIPLTRRDPAMQQIFQLRRAFLATRRTTESVEPGNVGG